MQQDAPDQIKRVIYFMESKDILFYIRFLDSINYPAENQGYCTKYKKDLPLCVYFIYVYENTNDSEDSDNKSENGSQFPRQILNRQ